MNHDRGATFVTSVASAPNPRDRRVACLNVVPCPECGMPADKQCVTSRGATKTTPHRARRIQGVRAERAAEEAATREYAVMVRDDLVEALGDVTEIPFLIAERLLPTVLALIERGTGK